MYQRHTRLDHTWRTDCLRVFNQNIVQHTIIQYVAFANTYVKYFTTYIISQYKIFQFSVYQIEKDYVVPCGELISKAYAWREL